MNKSQFITITCLLVIIIILLTNIASALSDIYNRSWATVDYLDAIHETQYLMIDAINH